MKENYQIAVFVALLALWWMALERWYKRQRARRDAHLSQRYAANQFRHCPHPNTISVTTDKVDALSRYAAAYGAMRLRLTSDYHGDFTGLIYHLDSTLSELSYNKMNSQ